MENSDWVGGGMETGWRFLGVNKHLGEPLIMRRECRSILLVGENGIWGTEGEMSPFFPFFRDEKSASSVRMSVL